METENLIASLSSEAVPIRPMGSPWRLTAKWLLGFIAYIVLVLVTLESPRDDILLELNQPLFALELLALAGMVTTCALSAALLSFPDLYQVKRVAYLPIAAFVLFAGVIMVGFVREGAPMAMIPEDFVCTAFITLYSLLPAVWLFYSIRKFASTHFALAGSVAVLTSFSIGALVQRIVEKTDSIAHVLAYHYLPMFLFAVLGLLLGRKLLRW
jgi:hypothetical protein